MAKKNFTGILLSMMALEGKHQLSWLKANNDTIKPQPKNGQLIYYFAADGSFYNDNSKTTDYIPVNMLVFECFAINDANAIRKFNKWNFEHLTNKNK